MALYSFRLGQPELSAALKKRKRACRQGSQRAAKSDLGKRKSFTEWSNRLHDTPAINLQTLLATPLS